MFESLLTDTLNRLIEQDPSNQDRLTALEGKVLTLVCVLPLSITMQCTVLAGRIQITLGDQLTSHAKIAGTPMQLFRVGLLQATSDAFQIDDINVEGDMELAENWLRLFREANIDLEELVAESIGDAPAHLSMRFMQKMQTLFSKNVESFEGSMHEYLHEELKAFPSKEHLTTFLDDVDRIRQDTERLAAKIALFENELKGHS